MTLPPEVEELLRDHLPEQRWYGGKGRPVAAVTVESSEGLGSVGDRGARLELVVVRVDYASGAPERYQVPLGLGEEAPTADRAVLGRLGGDAPAVAFDALYDHGLAGLLLRGVATGQAVAHGQPGQTGGRVRFARVGDAEIEVDLPNRLVGAEQSNTSVIYGDRYILKVFRRLAPGVNPDLEVTRALVGVGCRHVPAPLGYLETDLDGQPTTLALLQEFLTGGSEGWALATISVRDLYAEADLHADEVGGDFGPESQRLGVVTAEVHADLSRALETREGGGQDCRALAAGMTSRLDEALDVVPELASQREALAAAYDELAAREGPLPLQRIHGDYHLGQVLRTIGRGWMMLDFEGEPARPLAERRALSSPLRDVAGMLRSYEYAARHLLADHPTEPGLAYRATEWAERNRNAFCQGYAESSGRDPREDEVLLRAFELDKAVYEVVYEARHRPSWLPIPLGSIERLAG